MKRDLAIDGVQRIELDSWVDFIDLIRDRHKNCPGFIYRGQGDADWKIDSCLDRLERKHPRTTNRESRFGKPNPAYFDCPPLSRPHHLSAFQEATRSRLGLSIAEQSDDEWWALAQHHGLATPMMDWTYSPFVALYFAFEEEKCINAVGELIAPQKRAVICTGLDIYNQIENVDDRPIAFVPKNDSNYRLVNQAGLFMKMPKDRDLESIVRDNFKGKSETLAEWGIPNVVLDIITIANKDRVDCLKFLNKMNINRMSLFPDLDGAARYTNSLWELEYDRMLGFVRLRTNPN